MGKHQPHPCIMCGEITTNRSYCDLHYKLLTRPPHFVRQQKLITADVAGNTRIKRETNKLFGRD